MKDLPKISVVLPTLNEEENIKSCLKSIFQQNYPKNKLEVILVDQYSEDRTIEIAREFPVKIIMEKIKNCEKAKSIGLKKSTGNLFMFIDADAQLPGKDWFKKMTEPLRDKNVVASFSVFKQHPDYSRVTKFLTHDNLQRDPLLEFLTPDIEDFVIKEKENYSICNFNKKKIPPIGWALIRRDALEYSGVLKLESYFDVEVIKILVDKGFVNFAYVPDTGYYHFHADSINHAIMKRLRNVETSLIPNLSWRKYKWIDKNPKEILKFILWLIYIHLLILPLIRGVYKAIKYRDINCVFYEPVMSLTVTDSLLFNIIFKGNLKKILQGDMK